MNNKWLYRTIHGYPDDYSWYFKLLSDVVKPFIDKNNPIIDRFFFLHYYPKYGNEPEGSKLERKLSDKETNVAFIRLRIRVEQKDLHVLETSLLDFIKRSSVVRETEPGTYDVMGDLGKRYGNNRVEELIDYLDKSSRLCLTFCQDEEQYYHYLIPDFNVNPAHLVCNIMNYYWLRRRNYVEGLLKNKQYGDYIVDQI